MATNRHTVSRRSLLRAGGAVLATVATTVACDDAPKTAPSNGLLIRNVSIFDGERILDADSVRVRNGMIIEVGVGLTGAGDEVHDGAGGTLVPGLIDAHTHVANQIWTDAPRFGVTTMLDMYTSATPWLADAAVARAATSRTAKADVWSAGIGVTAPGGWPDRGDIPTVPPDADAAAIDAFVADRVAEGSDYIKIFIEAGYRGQTPTLTDDQVHAAVAAAHRRDKLAVVHVSATAGAVTAAEAGADALVHIPYYQRFTEVDVAVLRSAGIAVVATLSVWSAVSCQPHAAELRNDPRVAPFLSHPQDYDLSLGEYNCASSLVFENGLENVRRLHRAGVPVLAGTDTPNKGTAFGVSMFGELSMLVEAGMTPAEALTGATAAVADVFGLSDRGRIAAGKRADLVLVDGDPTADIDLIRKISAVWKNGYPIDRSPQARATE